MKNKNLWLKILALAVGMMVAGCKNVNNDLPESNVNEVSGWTCYVKQYGKLVFSTTADGDTNGIYTVEAPKQNEDTEYFVLDENDKYTYEDVVSGTYTWNKEAGTITLTMEGEDDTYYAYSFSADEKALFLAEALPVNEGTNELSGQTYNGLKSASEKDTDQEYDFTVSGYTFTWDFPGTTFSTETEVGSYAYDSSQNLVWLRPAIKNGKNMAEYYAEQEVSDGHHYVDDYAYRAMKAHEAFKILCYQYFSKDKVILYIDKD